MNSVSIPPIDSPVDTLCSVIISPAISAIPPVIMLVMNPFLLNASFELSNSFAHV